jgi:3-oxoacyl-[acyl-carrier-protein] synthase-3
LLLTADTLSKYLHPRDKCNRSLFGDAASATIISRVGFARIGDFSLGTDGAGAENIIVRTGATRHTKKLDDTYFDENGNPHSSDYLYINGHNVFSFVQTHIPNIVFDTVAKNNLSINDVDFFVFHQASSLLLNFLRKKLKIPEEKFYLNLQDVGNTSSNSIPIALSESKNNGRLVGNTLLCGFGVGYSWGSCMLKIQSTFE